MKLRLIIYNNKIWLCKPNVKDIKTDYGIFPFFTVEHLKEYFDTDELFRSLMESKAGDTSHFIFLDGENNFFHRDLLKFYDNVLNKTKSQNYDDFELHSYIDGYYEFHLIQK